MEKKFYFILPATLGSAETCLNLSSNPDPVTDSSDVNSTLMLDEFGNRSAPTPSPVWCSISTYVDNIFNIITCQNTNRLSKCHSIHISTGCTLISKDVYGR